MQNSELLYLCKQFAAGQINWQDYREFRARLLLKITYDEDRTVPVGNLQPSSTSEPDSETTRPMLPTDQSD
jgi:hypothetical protein